ncbi:MAG: hypothetical protein RBT75_06600 [Anaerolineae bacterium]|jgi:hypothetical protein|nr:hypothetical protein [Anaerolineae bacterium]
MAQRTKMAASKSRAQVVDEKATVSLAEEYRYVLVDLKRIAILAVAMLGLLVVLALVLT